MWGINWSEDVAHLLKKSNVTVGNNWDHDLPIIGQVIQLLQEPINLDFIIIVYLLD